MSNLVIFRYKDANALIDVDEIVCASLDKDGDLDIQFKNSSRIFLDYRLVEKPGDIIDRIIEAKTKKGADDDI